MFSAFPLENGDIVGLRENRFMVGSAKEIGMTGAWCRGKEENAETKRQNEIHQRWGTPTFVQESCFFLLQLGQ